MRATAPSPAPRSAHKEPLGRSATRALLLLVGVLLSTGCATSGPTDGSIRRSPDFISAEELHESANIGDMWMAIERLRPNWLRGRGGRGGTPVVFVNGQRYGEIAALRGMPVSDVESARLVNAGDATTLYGTGYPGGIIDLRIRRR